MDLLPTEILKIIFNYCEHRTRRIARLSCFKWFKLIDYRDFALYLTRKSEWPRIVERLSSYSKPISLHICKSNMNMNTMEQFIEGLVRLTSLTALSFDELVATESDLSSWLKLTALPSLYSIRVESYEYEIPLEAIFSLSHLTTFDQRYSSEDRDNLQLQRAIQRWTNLQSCSISQRNTIEIDLWPSYNTKLTYLYVGVPTLTESWLRNLGNLLSLNMSLRNDKTRSFSLKSLTALESLNMNNIQLQDLNTTRLTFLELFDVNEKFIEKEAHHLTGLKTLIFDFEQNNDDNATDLPRYSYQWFTTLTSLEYLNIEPLDDSGLSFISTKLTSLQLTVSRRVDLSHVTRFDSLNALYLRFSSALPNLSPLSVLTKLIDLQVKLYDSEMTCQIDFLSTMTNLTWLDLLRCSPGKISDLPNLECLYLIYSTGCQFSGFDGLSKLTELEINRNRQTDAVNDFDYTFVSKLTTLQRLAIDPSRFYDCNYFSTLTALQSLTIDCVTSEDYCYLSTLTCLTELRVRHGPSSTKLLSLPTSLQLLKIELSTSDQLFPSDELVVDEEELAKLTKLVVERLPNLYEYSFK